MFEKEAEEWVKENMDCCKTDNSVNQSISYFSEEERCITKSAFKDGAEFGYNKGYHDAEEHYMNVIDSQHKLVDESKKVNEWHFVKDGDLPKEKKEYWCKVFYYESEETFNAFLWFDPSTKEFKFLENIGEDEVSGFNVKEWCEIPEE